MNESTAQHRVLLLEVLGRDRQPRDIGIGTRLGVGDPMTQKDQRTRTQSPPKAPPRHSNACRTSLIGTGAARAGLHTGGVPRSSQLLYRLGISRNDRADRLRSGSTSGLDVTSNPSRSLRVQLGGWRAAGAWVDRQLSSSSVLERSPRGPRAQGRERPFMLQIPTPWYERC